MDGDGIDRVIHNAISQSELPCFLVAGKNKTGRTFTSNYILNQYRIARDVAQDRFIIPEREFENHDESHVLLDWIGYLYEGLDDPKFTLISDNLKEIHEICKTKEMPIDPLAQGIFHKLSSKLTEDNLPAAFGVCFESIRNHELISKVKKIFKRTQTVVIFTTDDYEGLGKGIKQLFNPRVDKPCEMLINLHKFMGDDVKTFAEKRWIGINSHPFDDTGFKEAFTSRWPISQILRSLAFMIELKLAEHPEGAKWPEAQELLITAKQMETTINELGKY